jgi:hypothetical protein
MALLKLNVNFDPIVIGADTRDSCGKSGLRETPQALSEEEAPEPPAKKRAPGVEITRQARLTELFL